ncbi:hypothetical protein [Candidatus Palauibacter sp.]|uniref:hypothetical protein n=1 Tax=Candidatus Palauibacter sp. TaxID=3101350 RepID=UPI003AF27259
MPTPIDDENSAFTFAIPFDPAWTEALDRITLAGPEGSATLDRARGGRAALLVDRTTGRVRSIARDVPAGFGDTETTDGGMEVVRGLPQGTSLKQSHDISPPAPGLGGSLADAVRERATGSGVAPADRTAQSPR